MKKALIIGGSSGLGLALAQQLKSEYDVIATGRRLPDIADINFKQIDLTQSNTLAAAFDNLLHQTGEIDLLIYAAGFYQGKTIGETDDSSILEMMYVGTIAPAMILQRIIKSQARLSNFIAITSTSQWTPRRIEPIYTASKAGLGMLANSVAEDEAFGKVMVAGPAGMKTRFWEKEPREESVLNTMLDPTWVAEQIINEYKDEFSYKFIRILREPERIELIEKR